MIGADFRILGSHIGDNHSQHLVATNTNQESGPQRRYFYGGFKSAPQLAKFHAVGVAQPLGRDEA